MPFSSKTLTPVASGELNSTSDDMRRLFEWKYGDDISDLGSHAKSYAPHARLRADLARGRSAAKHYKHNMKFVNTFKSVSEQLANF